MFIKFVQVMAGLLFMFFGSSACINVATGNFGFAAIEMSAMLICGYKVIVLTDKMGKV